MQIKTSMKVTLNNILGNFLNGKKHGNGIYHYSTGGKFRG